MTKHDSSRPAADPPTPSPPSRLLLGACLVLIALNLRPLFSSVAAVLPEITRANSLSPGSASLLTTVPVLCLGLFAPVAPWLAGRFGAERAILGLLALLAAGTAMRGWGTMPALLAAAILAGGSIAVVNVLLPGLVKRDFPDHLALMTGLFSMALSAGAAAAAGLTVPLQALLDGSWSRALGIWAAPVVITLVLWGLATRGSGGASPALGASQARLWRSRLAWQITLFMGLQSAIAYCVFGYLAPILRERGMEAATAGLIVSWSIVMQCLACLLAPVIAIRRRDQRIVNVVFFALAVIGFVGCVFAPLDVVVVSATLQGFGQGGLIALAMTAIVLRSADARVAAGLSSMAQGVGYALAAGGPLLLGLLRGATGSYASAAALVTVLGVMGAWCAYGAGRLAQIAGPATQPPA